MRTSRFSAKQISTALHQVESRAPVAEVTRKLAVSEKTYYLWKKRYAHLLTKGSTRRGDCRLALGDVQHQRDHPPRRPPLDVHFQHCAHVMTISKL